MKNLDHNSLPDVVIDKQCRAEVSVTWYVTGTGSLSTNVHGYSLLSPYLRSLVFECAGSFRALFLRSITQVVSKIMSCWSAVYISIRRSPDQQFCSNWILFSAKFQIELPGR